MSTEETRGKCRVIKDGAATEIHFNREEVEKLLAGDSFFWLDLDRPDGDDFEILRDVFKFHRLAVEDSEHFDQRAKIEDYDDFTFLVLFGAAPDDDGLVEVHAFYSERCLVTVHRDEAPAFTEARERFVKRAEPVKHPPLLLYHIVQALVDSFFPILSDFDERIDELEDQTFTKATDAQLQEIFQMKRVLVGLRKAITPERDMFAKVAAGIEILPGMSQEDERYFRDTYDHLIRISDLIDTYRDLLTSSMDVYLSTVSNRLNQVVKQLTIIATIFLPLSVADRLLRPELRLPRAAHHRRGDVRGARDRHRARRRRAVALLLQEARMVLMKTRFALACTAGALAIAATATAATGMKGTWVASGPTGKYTLKLAGSGTAYHGTLTTVAGGKKTVAKVKGRFDNADGSKQLTLTFTATHRTSICGLVGTKLYCQLGTGTATFTRA